MTDKLGKMMSLVLGGECSLGKSKKNPRSQGKPVAEAWAEGNHL